MTLLLLGVAVGLVGCDKKRPSGEPGGAGGGAPVAGDPADAGIATAVEPAPAPTFDKAAVRALLDAWVAAQNGGDFAGYERVYAAKFEGVKRAGPRTWRYDRAGWMADRQRMFKRPMQVSIDDLELRGDATAVTVGLVQRFQQGTFADRGPKRLVVVPGKAGLQIAREEMLSSEINGGSAPAAGGAAFLIIDIDGRPYVVIRGAAEEAWARGAPTGPHRAGTHLLAMRDGSAAPAAASWAHRELRAYDRGGASCAVTVGALRLVAGGTPHFGQVQQWDGDPEMSADGRVWTPAERARTLWNLSAAYLVGELAVTGDCKPVVAVDAASSAVVAARAAAPPALGAVALAAYRELPAYAQLSREFREGGGKGDWVARPEVERFTAGDRTFVVVSASEGSGCGGFLGQLTAIFEVKGKQLTLMSNPEDGFLKVSALLDSDGDGAFEVIGELEDFSMLTAHLVPGGGHLRAASVVTFPFNDCGC